MYHNAIFEKAPFGENNPGEGGPAAGRTVSYAAPPGRPPRAPKDFIVISPFPYYILCIRKKEALCPIIPAD
jgi:hypothetical protein